MKKFLFSLFIIIIVVRLCAQKTQTETFFAEESGYFVSPVETPFGIVFTDNYASKLMLLNNQSVKILVQSPGCGRNFSLTPDRTKITFKSINTSGKQAPALYDLAEDRIEILSDYYDLCGQAFISEMGDLIYFTASGICKKASIYDNSEISIKTSAQYSNLAVIAPNGSFLVYDLDQKGLFLLNLSSGNEFQIPDNGKGVIYPKWSPDSKKILFQNHEEELWVYDIMNSNLYKIGKGGAGYWHPDSEKIIFQRTLSDPINMILNSSELFISDFRGMNICQLTFSDTIYEMTPSFNSKGEVLYQTYNHRQIVKAILNNNLDKIISSEILLDNPINIQPVFYNIEMFTKNKEIVTLTNPVPYVHQLYDAPTGRNGNAACAATTSIMAAAYYNRLPKWPVEANNYPSITGQDHYSDYSGYVLDRYRYNEFTFDAYSASKNAYGGYAYMWVDPYSSPGSGGMQAYQNLHDMSSGDYVWLSNCTYEKTQIEINGQWPHSICSWITASGHLTLAIGYVVGQGTVIFNDPWGDKNTPGYPSYDGNDAYYDWPGSNNGFQNLDPDGSHGSVAWTLTARSEQPDYDPLIIENINYNHGFYMNNSENGSIQNYYRHVINSAGHSGHIWWTGAEGGASSDICHVTWTPEISSSGIYKVEAYIPASFTDSYSSVPVTSSAYYKVFHAEGQETITVNQLANQGTWVNLGNYLFMAGENGYVYLGDAVAAGDDGKKVLFDAVRYTEISGPLCGTFTIDNTLPASGINFTNFTDAISSLNEHGVQCDVVFNVSAGQIFNENPPAITSSGTIENTITFQKFGEGNNPVINAIGGAGNEDFGININGGDYFRFDGIDVSCSPGNNLEYGYYLTNATSTDGAGNNIIKNCTITLDASNANTVGIIQYIRPEITPVNESGANSFNLYNNVNIINAFHGIKINGYDLVEQELLYDDACVVSNCTINGFGYPGASTRAVGILTWSQKNLSIHHNTIMNGTSNYRTLGIYGAGNNTGNVFNNKVNGLFGTGSQVVGLRAWESNLNFYNNEVYDIEGVDMAAGIEIYGGVASVYNNFVFDIRTPSTNSFNYPTTRGISNRAGVVSVYNNSILLNFVSAAPNNESAGIFIEGFSGDIAEADIRNNIVINKTDVSIGSVAVALYKSPEFSTISGLSDHNLYFSGTPSSKNLIFYDTNTAIAFIEDYKTWCSSYEQNSKSFDAPYTGTSDLHILTSSITSIDGGAQVIPGLTIDIDGDTRDASTPDIGADEFDCDYIFWTGAINTDWSNTDNWHRAQVPTLTDHVIIPDVSGESNRFPIISTAAETNQLYINMGANLQILPDFSLTVHGSLTNDAGISGLFIRSDATGTGSLISSTPDVPGTVERYLTGNQWHYLTAPIENAPLFLFNTNNFYWYDETTEDSWSGGTFSGTSGWTAYTDEFLTSMQGYAYYYTPTTIVYEGNLHAGTYSSTFLSFTDTPMPDQYDGWHLLGNPYPSALDWNSPGISYENLDQTVYFYDDNIDNYRYYNPITGGINGGTQFVPAGQGFFVHTSVHNAQLTLTDIARLHNTTDFYKEKSSLIENEAILIQTDQNGLNDETKLIVLSNSGLGFDGQFDAYKMYTDQSQVPFIWTEFSDFEFAGNAIPAITEETTIPLGFFCVNSGTCEIRLIEETVSLPIYLYDAVENRIQNLNEEPSYTFIHSGGKINDRFELLFSEASYLKERPSENIRLFPNPSSGIIFVTLPELTENETLILKIMEMTGREILESKIRSEGNKCTIDLKGLSPGVYMIEIHSRYSILKEKLIIQI